MSERSCLPQNLVLGDTGFSSGYRYRTVKRLEDILSDPTFFVPVRSQVKAADFVRLVQMEYGNFDRPDNRVLRLCEAVIHFVGQRAVHLERISPLHEMPLDLDEVEAAAAAVPVGPKLVPKWNGPTDMWTVIGPDGRALVKGIKDKKVAEQMAAGAIPLPDAAPAPTSTPVENPATPAAAAF